MQKIYRITGNFCSFGFKRRHLFSAVIFIFILFIFFYSFFLRFENLAAKIFCLCNKLFLRHILFCYFYTPARRESGIYRDPHVRPSVCRTFGFRMIITVPLNQIFSNFKTMLWTIKYRLSSITVYFTFTVPELWPFFS